MSNQKTISLRIDQDLYNMIHDRAVMERKSVGRTINAAIEHYLLYQDYKNSAAPDLMTFDEYYNRKSRHDRRPAACRPSAWRW